MIKIRLEGLPAYVKAVALVLRNIPVLRVVEESKEYPNRGTSEFVRRYMTVMFAELPEGEDHEDQ